MYLERLRINLMCSTGSRIDHVFMDLQGRPFNDSYFQRFLANHGAQALNPSIC